MLRLFFIISLFASFVYSHSYYTVRLAVFKNAKQLQKNIDTYPLALKKTVKTYRKKGFTYAYTVPTTNKKTLETLLPAYKKVFHDAYIQPTKRK